MAATNRPDMLDPALTRPGRLDKTLYVGLPSEQGRLSILKALTHKMTDILSPDLDLESISKNEKLASFSGADLASLVREASMQAMYQDLDKCLKEKDHVFGQEQKFEKISLENFTQAMEKVRPSISKKDLLEYSSKK